MHHPVTEHEQLNGQTHEKTGHQRKELGQTTMLMYAVETKAPMPMSQAMHKQNPINAQVSKADEVQQGQLEEQYV